MRAIAVAVLAGITLAAQGAPAIDDVARAALANRVDGHHTVGIDVGLATSGGRVFVGLGSIAKGGPAPTQETFFEIGSITKVFTALLLADMVERGEVALDDPVSKYLPASVTVPSSNGRAITLADLTTHTSGLPRLPTNLETTNLDNPYATYDVTKLYAFLSGYHLPREPGAQWEYSNLGAGLLGHALTRRSGLSYEQLVKTRILDPLGMKNTTITLTPALRQRFATAHDEGLREVSLWDLDALAGAGALRSTADDLLTFAAAHAGLVDTPLATAMARMRALRRPGAVGGPEQAMGWLVIKPFGSEVFMHDGGTHGFRSAIAIDPAGKRAAVAWANAPLDVTDLAAHLVEPRVPLPPRDSARAAAVLDAQTLQAYVGVYQFAPTVSIEITREGERLFAQLTKQPRFELFAEKRDEFFLRSVQAQISFARDDSGAVVALILHQNGIDQRASKAK